MQSHRPYPVPSRPWVMSMKWLNLAFMHWRVPAESLRPLIPEQLELDLFEGEAYLAVVPFEMRDVKPRFSPSVPGLSHFAELNVRTYVKADGKAGVWFFSLDAANAIAVMLARAGFFLPYFNAKMSCLVMNDTVFYHSQRFHKGAAQAEFVASYKATSPVYLAKKGSLEHFLTERYCLYSANNRGEVFRGEIHHEPWPLQQLETTIQLNQMTEQLNIELANEQALLHFAKRLDVVAWLPEKL